LLPNIKTTYIMGDDWTDDIEEILSKVRQNCIDMYKYHLCRYFQYKRVLPLFRVPVLILNALNSVFSVGLQPYMEQSLISVLNCLISLIATLINSIEMYMGIQKSMESEMSSSQGFYILSIGIYKMLTLTRENRDVSGKQYLMECYNTYSELVRNSKLIKDPYMLQKDFLQNVDKTIGGIRDGMVGLNDYSDNFNPNAESGFDLENVALRFLQDKVKTQLPYVTDVENGLKETPFIMPRFTIKDIPDVVVSSPYPTNMVAQKKRPSFTDEHDPLYGLSRKSIFGNIKKNEFLEMAGVELEEKDEVNSPEVSHHSQHNHQLKINQLPFVKEMSTHTKSSHIPVPIEFLKEELQEIQKETPPPLPLPPPPPQHSESPPQHQREKVVKDIIQKIENKPKKDI
jgi:hypothetical protein